MTLRLGLSRRPTMSHCAAVQWVQVQPAPLLGLSHCPTKYIANTCVYARFRVTRARVLFYFSLIDVERVGQVGQWDKARGEAGFSVPPQRARWGRLDGFTRRAGHCRDVAGTLPAPNPLIGAWH